jgi:hypothetical protein
MPQPISRLPAFPCVPAPYAIAFAIEELLLVRSWAQQRGLHLTIATDQVRNGAEFEEMLILTSKGRQPPSLMIWRTANAVFAQTPQSRPHGFATLKELLAALHPAQKARGPWRRLLGLAG